MNLKSKKLKDEIEVRNNNIQNLKTVEMNLEEVKLSGFLSKFYNYSPNIYQDNSTKLYYDSYLKPLKLINDFDGDYSKLEFNKIIDTGFMKKNYLYKYVKDNFNFRTIFYYIYSEKWIIVSVENYILNVNDYILNCKYYLKNDKLNGDYKLYDKNGKIIECTKYYNGKILNQKYFNVYKFLKIHEYP